VLLTEASFKYFIPLTIEQLGICYENVLLLLQQPLCFYLQILFYPFKQYEVNHEIIVYK